MATILEKALTQFNARDDEEQVKELSINTRKNLNNADGTPDTKPWRFTKV